MGTTTRFFYLLRFWRQKSGDVQYACDMKRHANKRDWWYSEKRGEAYEFNYRSDARATIKSVAFDKLLRPRSAYCFCENFHRVALGRCKDRPELAYYWEVVKVTETIVTTSVEEIIVSDAPAMVVLARASQ